MPTEVTRRLRQVLGLQPEREFLRTDQIAARYVFPSAEAARKWIKRHRVPHLVRGRLLLVDVRDFEAALEKGKFRKAS